MKIHFVCSELVPLAQTGGLGDAVAGLAAALVARGHEVVCVLPAYASLLAHSECPPLAGFPGPAIPGNRPSRWLRGALASGIELCLLDVPGLYAEGGFYDGDAVQQVSRFASLSMAAAALAADEQPDALVAHDWQGALALCHLRTRFDEGPGRSVAALQVVHNGAHQGRFGASLMAHTGLPGDLFHADGLEFYGDLCLLKGALMTADRIVAVSPQYASELVTPEGGFGLEGVYASRSERLSGIANGIDAVRFDPANDPVLAAPFSADEIAGRAECRSAVLGELELKEPPPGRFLAAVGRFDHQKGWDVLADALPDMLDAGAHVALLGEGDTTIAAQLVDTVERFPGRLQLFVGWNDELARRLYAGADAVLVPSRFEPCGLVQLIAQRYGCLPIAHRVGGLVDTIRDAETGILFSPLTPHELIEAVERGVALIERRSSSGLSAELARLDVSWAEPARRWEELLVAATQEARGRAS